MKKSVISKETDEDYTTLFNQNFLKKPNAA